MMENAFYFTFFALFQAFCVLEIFKFLSCFFLVMYKNGLLGKILQISKFTGHNLVNNNWNTHITQYLKK